jgi:predicted PurR-regulated permease PerM
VFALKYLPYLGPFTGIIVLTLAGVISFPSLGQALLPPGLYLVFVIVEGQLLTPIVLARRLTLNPVALFVSLIIWAWLWGVPGALLAVPLLATFKILCDHIRRSGISWGNKPNRRPRLAADGANAQDARASCLR